MKELQQWWKGLVKELDEDIENNTVLQTVES
jgi:hypothetical protein